MGKLSRNIPARQWWIWLALLFVLGALLLVEYRASSAQDMSLETNFSHPAGSYDDDIRLELSTGYPGAEIYYSLDGQLPDPQSGIRYTEPILFDAAQARVVIIRAQSYLPEGKGGLVSSATYFMGMQHELPLLSIIVDPDDFWGEEKGIYTNHEQRGRDWERPVDLTYVSGNDEGFHVGAGMRIHGGWTRFFSDKKSLRLYFRNEYGVPKLEYPLFGQEGQTAFDHLILHNSNKDLLLFRNQLVERLTEQIGGYATRSQPALIFINGRPWGIYNIREQIDERLLEENYGVPSADISDTPNNRGMQSEEQLAVDTVHWENFIEFVLANDLSDAENYAYVQSQIDLANFIDYYILQMYAANSDWPHHNVHQFRPRTQGGRWEWIVWDNDLAFDRVEQQMVDHVLDIDHPLGERMEIMLNKLLANPEFHNLFLTRAADLLNTDLSTAQVQATIEALAAELDNDVNQEKARWDISAKWDDTLQSIREFAARRPDIMRQHFVDSLDLPGIVEISFDQATPGDPGWIVVNNAAPQQLPWKGKYFQGTHLELQVIPPAGSRFAAWSAIPESDFGESATFKFQAGESTDISAYFTDLPQESYLPGDVTLEKIVINDPGDIEGDWIELRVNHEGGINLDGWRISDNDTVEADDEGSLILKSDSILKNVPKGTLLRIVATESRHNASRFPTDGWQNGVLLLYAGNGRIDTETDPWFNLGRRDNLVILAPGSSTAVNDDVPIDFWSNTKVVTSSSFGLPPTVSDE